MSSYKLAITRMPIPKTDLFLGLNAGLKFKCNICKATGEDLVCICNKCKSTMHPSCAGVEEGIVYGADETEQVVLPGSEKLPKSCPACLKEMEGAGLKNQVFLQQTNYVQAPSGSSTTRSMFSYKLAITRIPIPKSDLFLGLNARLKFNCSICKVTGEQLVCSCNKCKSSMHPSCAGVEAGIVYGPNETEQVVLPGSEKLRKSCPVCLKEMEGAGLKNQVFLQQTNYVQPPPGRSITSVVESGKSHKVEEGHGDCMVHIHNPGHDLWLKDNGEYYMCHACKMDGFGPHYACGNVSCPFLLHQECFSPRKTITHSFFPQSTFLFMCLPSEHINVFCDACGMNVKGYYYHDRNGLYALHPCCVNLASQIICGDSGAKMVLQKESTSKCGYCHERSVKMGKISTDRVWSYVADNENFHLHVGCLIKMLSDWREDSMAHLISCNMISTNSSARMKMKIALRRAMNTHETKFKILVKYLKIALGAVISAFLGDPTTLFVNTAVALISN